MNFIFLVRLVIASSLGALIGLEREIKAKEAGIRTHFLVALAGALIMIVSQHGFNDVIGLSGYDLDPARVAAQVVSGIGFIGAGMIIIEKDSIKGLTSAAGLWATAGIGLTIGGGLYFVGIVATGLILLAFEMSTLTSKKTKHRILSFEITITDKKKINDLYDLFNKKNRQLKQYRLSEIEDKGNKINSAKYIVQLKNDREEKKLVKEIQKMEDTIIREINYPGEEA